MNNLQLESLEDVEMSLVQILNDGTNPAVTICLGTGSESRQTAARLDDIYLILSLCLSSSSLQVCFVVHQDHG